MSELQLNPATTPERARAAPRAEPAAPERGRRAARTLRPSRLAPVLESGGEPLDPAARSYLAAAFRRDFGPVRVHAGERAAASARELGADAYTVGRHIVFGRGRYEPRRPSGVGLLAHELAHTLQGPEELPADAPLELSPTTSATEHAARTAARDALTGRPPAALARGSAVVHRAESGTYVSSVGDPEYLDAGAAFYRTWGYPNVKRIQTLDDVLVDLDATRGPIEKFRLVSHGFGNSLELGLMKDVHPGGVAAEEAGFTSEAAFRKELTEGPKLLDDATYTSLVVVLQKDAVTSPFLTTLGAAAAVPATDSSLGILLRAMLETFFVANVQLAAGGAPTIKNRGILDAYNQRRIAAYTTGMIRDTPAASKAAVTTAISSLRGSVDAALARANTTFTLTQDDADVLADPFADTNRPGTLSATLSTEIAEGAGTGPFLPRLRRVQARISAATLIEVRGCTIGRDPPFLDALRGFFGAPGQLPKLTAPDLFQYYFRLNYETFTAAAADEAKLRTEFDDPATGLASGSRSATLAHAKQLVVVANEPTLDEVSRRYKGPSTAALQALNPKVDPKSLTPGTLIWLTAPATRTVPTGGFTTLGDVCEKELGNRLIWPAVWALNPAILDPAKLPGGNIVVPAEAASFSELLATLRGGTAVAVARADTNKPTVYLDDAKRATELADWLAKQKWDPAGATAAALSGRYLKDFGKAAHGTYVEFLSRSYPQIVDPIFPDDPRYAVHIIPRP
jgi:hypothetical protein